MESLASRLTKDEERKDDVAALRLILDSIRRLTDDQTKRIELMRSSTRQLFAYAAGFFAVAQTIAGGALSANPGPTTPLVYAVIALAVVSAVVLGSLGVVAINVDALSQVRIRTPEMVIQAYFKADLADTETGTLHRLIKLEREAIRARTAMIAARDPAARRAKFGSIALLLLVAAEIVVSLISRI